MALPRGVGSLFWGVKPRTPTALQSTPGGKAEACCHAGKTGLAQVCCDLQDKGAHPQRPCDSGTLKLSPTASLTECFKKKKKKKNKGIPK